MAPRAMYSDGYVCLRNLHVEGLFGSDAWGRLMRPQPAIVTVKLRYNLSKAASMDDVNSTVSYSDIKRKVTRVLRHQGPEETSGFAGLPHFHKYLGESLQSLIPPRKDMRDVEEVEDTHFVETTLPDACLRSSKGIKTKTVFGPGWLPLNHTIYFMDLELYCIVGVNDYERKEKQRVILNLEINPGASEPFGLETYQQWRPFIKLVSDFVESSDCLTLEALAYGIVSEIRDYEIPYIIIKIDKPDAVSFADRSGIEMTFAAPEDEEHPPPSAGAAHEGGGGGTVARYQPDEQDDDDDDEDDDHDDHARQEPERRERKHRDRRERDRDRDRDHARH